MDRAILESRLRSVAESLASHGVRAPELFAVLGSGLGGVADRLEDARRIPFAEVDGLPRSGVPGHRGEFVFGRCAGRAVLVQSGRVHLYEGVDARAVAISVRAAAALGARTLLATNAAGSLRADWPVGTWMRITDQLDLQGASALLPDERGSGTPYTSQLGAIVDAFAVERGLDWQSGVYAGLIGPRYETPADVRALQKFGADAVGMSTVKEAAVAHRLGLRVVGLSCLANLGAGLGSGPLTHEDVVATGGRAAHQLAGVFEELVGALFAGQP